MLLTTQQKEDFMAIHKAIHDKAGSVQLSDKQTPVLVTLSPNGCRKVDYSNITFMEQNKEKNSVYAKRAREGERITWGIIPNKSWLLITDHGIA